MFYFDLTDRYGVFQIGRFCFSFTNAQGGMPGITQVAWLGGPKEYSLELDESGLVLTTMVEGDIVMQRSLITCL